MESGKCAKSPSEEAEEVEKADRSARDVHFAILSEGYEPLREEDEETEKAKQERKRKRKARNKKHRKNVGKALRFSWRCLLAGLQSLVAGCTTDLTSAVNVVRGNRGPI